MDFSEYTIIDGVVIALILISGFMAYSRGIVREVLSIVGWVGAAVIAFIFAPEGKDMVFEVPFVKGIVGDSCDIALIIAFVIIFLIALVVISLFTPLLAGAVSRSSLGPIDRMLGFIFGLARGVLLIVVALFAYDKFLGDTDPIKIVDESKTVALLADSRDRLANEVEGSTVPEWFIAKFDELANACPASANETPVFAPPSN